MINELISEIKELQKREKLLFAILEYWDKDTMTFNIPHKYSNLHRFAKHIQETMPKSPRHRINDLLEKTFDYSISDNYVNWDELGKKIETESSKRKGEKK